MIAPSTSLEGRLLSGRYRVERRLGSGAMGDVYLAEHTLMKKRVAIKVLHPEFVNNEEAVARFQREAQAAAHIDHHNVCVATDFGETDDGVFFLVMEYLEGRPLGDAIAEDGLSIERSVHVARQIASGLVRAHALEIVHRDLKPDNIMIVKREEDSHFVKIMDFGVARVQIGDAEKLTKAGTTYGTPAYMSPEQATGLAVDGRSDLYSLGIILYEMLTGAVPFYGQSVAVVMSAHTEKPVPPMSEAAPEAEIPPSLVSIVMRLLEKRPADRFQSAEEVEEALGRIELGPHKLTHETATLEPIARQSQRAAETEPEKAFSALETGGHATVSPSPVDLSSETLVDAPVARASRPSATSTEALRMLWGEMPIITKLGAIAAMLGLALVPVALVLAFSSSEIPDKPSAEGSFFGNPVTLAGERDEFAAREDVSPAVAALASDGLGAVDAFEAVAEAEPENAHAAYFLGLAHFKAEDVSRGVSAMRRAGELDPRYLESPALIETVFDHFEVEDEEDREAVRGFIEAHLLESEVGRERLAAEAAEGQNYRVRHAARKILEESGAKEKLARWRQVTVELRATDNCDALKQGVRELGEIGDPAGLPAVKRIEGLPRKGCGFLKRGDCYECLRGTVRKVVKTLEEAEAAAGPDAGAASEPAEPAD